MANRRLVTVAVRSGAIAAAALLVLVSLPAVALAQLDRDPRDSIVDGLLGLEAEGDAPFMVTGAELAGTGAVDESMVDALSGLVQMAVRRFHSGDELVVVLAADGPGVAEVYGPGFSEGFLEGLVREGKGDATFDSGRHVLRTDLPGPDGHSAVAYAVSDDSAVLIVAQGMTDDRLLEVVDAQLAHRPADQSLDALRLGLPTSDEVTPLLGELTQLVVGLFVIVGILGTVCLAMTGAVLLVTRRKRSLASTPSFDPGTLPAVAAPTVASEHPVPAARERRRRTEPLRATPRDDEP